MIPSLWNRIKPGINFLIRLPYKKQDYLIKLADWKLERRRRKAKSNEIRTQAGEILGMT